MTYITGLYEQLYKIWPDTLHGGPEHSEAILVFPLMMLDGWAWREAYIYGFNPGHKSYQLAAPRGLPHPTVALSNSPGSTNEVHALHFSFLPWETPFNL